MAIENCIRTAVWRRARRTVPDKRGRARRLAAAATNRYLHALLPVRLIPGLADDGTAATVAGRLHAPFAVIVEARLTGRAAGVA